jgi:hypothetical protein
VLAVLDQPCFCWWFSIDAAGLYAGSLTASLSAGAVGSETERRGAASNGTLSAASSAIYMTKTGLKRWINNLL